MRTTRRSALKTGLFAGLATLSPNLLRAQAASPNGQIAMGIIGCGGMGGGNMKSFLRYAGVRVIAVCDPDSKNREGAAKTVNNHYKNEDCKSYNNYRDMLAAGGLDAVVIATPDHMHAQIGIEAANAGCDIYGEKPFAWGLAEGRQLVEAVKKNKRVWQTGSQQRSGGEFNRFRALIQNDTLGKITRIECGTPGGMSIRNHAPQDKWPELIANPPAHLDWKTYCGPVAPDFPYHPMIHPWNWRWHETLGGGQLLDWVGHHVDIAMWTFGLHTTGPVKVEGTGKRGNHPFFNTFVEYQYKGTFADGRVIEVRSDFGGVKVTGENGWMHVNRGKLQASDEAMLRNLPEGYNPRIPNHHQNFLDCVKSRENPVSDAESSHRTVSFGMLGHVAIDTGRPLQWDPEKEAVLGDPETAKHPRLGSRVVL